MGDFNNDGNLDVVVSDGGPALRLLLGNGAGGFGGPINISANGPSDTYKVRAADVNNDGNLDIVTANNGPQTLSVILGSGDGTFALAENYPFLGNQGGRAVGLGDLNNDGYLDLIGGGCCAQTVVYLNSGDGRFGFAAAYQDVINSSRTDIRVADLDGDGNQDVLVANTVNINVFKRKWRWRPQPAAKHRVLYRCPDSARL